MNKCNECKGLEHLSCEACGNTGSINADECKRFAGERERFEAAYQADAIAAGLDIGQQLSRAPHDQDRYADAYAQAAWFGWQARAAQPAPVVPEGYALVPKRIYVDAASTEALAFVMGGPEEDDGTPTYCDCVMWVGDIDEHGDKRYGIHVYNTECEEEGSVTLAEFDAAPAQGQQVERWIPVSERLPEPFTVVALLDENRWMNTGCDDFEANWTGAGWLWANGINDNGMYWSAIGERHGLTMDTVTHWMPLPAAPTKGGDV